MTLNTDIYQENFRVRAYEIDTAGNASVQAICNYLQEIAGNHAAELGVSVVDLHKQGLTWVLSRLYLRMERFPRWREEIVINTWPSDLKGMFAIRDFEIRGDTGDLCGTATTSWMILDFRKQKPVHMPESVKKIKLAQHGRALIDPFEKIRVAENYTLYKEFAVRRSDLDINQHPNNVAYIEWALESIPQQFYQKYRLKDLEVSFRAETKMNETVVSYAEKVGDDFLHRLVVDSDKREIAVLSTKWEQVQK